MGEVGEYWKDVNRAYRKYKSNCLIENTKVIEQYGEPYRVFNNGVQINLYVEGIDLIVFYPSTNKWRYRNKTFRGSALKLLDWIEKERSHG